MGIEQALHTCVHRGNDFGGRGAVGQHRIPANRLCDLAPDLPARDASDHVHFGTQEGIAECGGVGDAEALLNCRAPEVLDQRRSVGDTPP